VTRIVFATQAVDPLDPALAATIPMLRALAERVDELVVLADRAQAGVLPQNAHVDTFGARTQLGRGLRFERALISSLRPRPDAVVAHMVPRYVLLAAPLVRPQGIPLLLWYTHWHAPRDLRVAEKLVTRVASVDRRSFPLPSKKLVALGHGIDVAEFPCTEHPSANALHALALGRYSPAKGLETIVRALALVPDVRLTVHGPTSNELERRHRAELARLVDGLQLVDRVRLNEAVPRADVPRLFAEADVLVNNMRAGAPDKAVYEACASCLPALASNPVFDDVLEPELRFKREEPESLAAALTAFAELGAEARADLGRRLRSRVAERHSVAHWADGLLQAIRS